MAGVEGPGAGGDGAGHQQGQLIVVARFQWQGGNGVPFHDRADGCRFGLQNRRRGGHFHRLIDVSDLELKIDFGYLIYLKFDLRLNRRFEPRVGHLHLIVAHGQARQIVEPGGIGDGGERGPAIQVPGHYRGANNRSTAGVGDVAGDRRGDILRHQRNRRDEGRKQKQRKNPDCRITLSLHQRSSHSITFC